MFSENTMGAFYCSINVRCENQQAVSEIWKALWRPEVACFISPCQNGWVSIFPDQCDADAGSVAISQRMNTSVLCLHVHDSDVFDYSYYKNGLEIDSFCSNPDYFNDGSDDAEMMRKMLASQPELLAELLTRPEDLEKLQSILDRMKTIPLCEDNFEDLFCELLGLDDALNAYSYMKQDGFDEEEGFIHFAPKKERRESWVKTVNKMNMLNLTRKFESDPSHGPAAAFVLAAWENLPEEITRMLDGGVDINIQDRNGSTALHLSVNSPTTKMMKFLLQHGANPSIQDNRGEITLHHLFNGGMAEKKALERAKTLLNAGADLTIKNNEGRTPIDLAAERGYDSIVQCFKDHLSQKQE